MTGIRAVAKQAGVSTETVRNVFTGAGTWEPSSDIVTRVHTAARELGYVYRPKRPALGGSLTIRIAAGEKDQDGRIGRARLEKIAERNGTDITHEVIDMLTYADANMPRKRRKTPAR